MGIKMSGLSTLTAGLVNHPHASKKSVIRSVNGLPPTNTDYIAEFPSGRFGKGLGPESMVKVVSQDKLVKCGKLEFHVQNKNYDLDFDLVCFSESALQFLRSEINDNNSPLWNISKSCADDCKLNGADSITELLNCMNLGKSKNIDVMMENMKNLRSLLKDLLDEKTLSFLSECFPVANGVAFPMTSKEIAPAERTKSIQESLWFRHNGPNKKNRDIYQKLGGCLTTINHNKDEGNEGENGKLSDSYKNHYEKQFEKIKRKGFINRIDKENLAYLSKYLKDSLDNMYDNTGVNTNEYYSSNFDDH